MQTNSLDRVSISVNLIILPTDSWYDSRHGYQDAYVNLGIKDLSQ